MGCSSSNNTEGDSNIEIRVIDSVAGTPNAPHTLSIKSEVLNEVRQIYIQLPEGYKHSNVKYPVLFVMDGEWLFHLVNANQRYYSYDEVTDQNIPNMIVVGIENTDRDRDYTPTSNSGKDLSFPTSGGANKFLEFLETELIPTLDNRYRTAPHRCLVGWSFSGLFSVYAGITKPNLFNMYLCISPAIWWDNDFIYKKMEDIKFEYPEKFVFTLGGGEANGWVHTSTTRLLKRLKEKPIPNMTVKHINIEGSGHTWAVSSAINLGLQSLYQEFIPRSDVIINNIDDVESYYRELSNKWAYEVIPSSKVFTNLVWNLWGKGEKEKAIKVLRYSVTINSTDSPSHFYLGQMLFIQDSLLEGLNFSELALKIEMNKSVPNSVNLTNYRAAIDKIKKKLTK
jgi:predicted alpha/beta superfamily hydrolase